MRRCFQVFTGLHPVKFDILLQFLNPGENSCNLKDYEACNLKDYELNLINVNLQKEVSLV